MNLAIDIGNTFIKAGLFKDRELIHSYHYLKEEDLDSIISTQNPEAAIISSVRKDISSVKSLFASDKCLIMNPNLKVPVSNLYKTPQTLGMDRLAAVIGAMEVFPGADVLVIDAGTCITFDFINKDSQYLGGAISPGIEMRFKALNTFTQKLPLVQRTPQASLIGGDTQECILSGVLNGTLAEIKGIISQYKTNFPELRVILCGGDAVFFESKIKESIFAVSDLVLMGLNSILLYNVSKG